MTLNLSRRVFFALVTTVALTGAAHAAEIELKLAWLTSDSETDPYAITAHAFKKELEAAFPGRVEVQLFPNRQLGDDKEILEGMQFGTCSAALNRRTRCWTVLSASSLQPICAMTGSFRWELRKAVSAT